MIWPVGSQQRVLLLLPLLMRSLDDLMHPVLLLAHNLRVICMVIYPYTQTDLLDWVVCSDAAVSPLVLVECVDSFGCRSNGKGQHLAR